MIRAEELRNKTANRSLIINNALEPFIKHCLHLCSENSKIGFFNKSISIHSDSSTFYTSDMYIELNKWECEELITNAKKVLVELGYDVLLVVTLDDDSRFHCKLKISWEKK